MKKQIKLSELIKHAEHVYQANLTQGNEIYELSGNGEAWHRTALKNLNTATALRCLRKIKKRFKYCDKHCEPGAGDCAQCKRHPLRALKMLELEIKPIHFVKGEKSDGE